MWHPVRWVWWCCAFCVDNPVKTRGGMCGYCRWYTATQVENTPGEHPEPPCYPWPDERQELTI